MAQKQALVVVQAYPPLLKNAGGVAKRYFSLCRALIDGLGWKVTLLTPVNVTVSGEADVDRWLAEGSLVHKAARGVRLNSVDGVVVVLDLFSFVNTCRLLSAFFFDQGKLYSEGRLSLSSSRFDIVFLDDVPWRWSLLLLARAAGVPSVMTSHTDGSKLESYKAYPALRLIWQAHVRSAHLATVHASVSNVFAEQMRSDYSIPVDATWPPILWAAAFRAHPDQIAAAAAEQRSAWLAALREQGMASAPTAVLLFAGRWSSEKRIHLLLDIVPDGAALVIVGDGTSDYSAQIARAGETRPQVLPLRKMLNGDELRVAYAAADLFCSASNFETLGNTLIEAWCSGTPCAVQPEQGHREFVVDGVNSWFVNYDEPTQAKEALTRIVGGGLHPTALARRLPQLTAIGERLRASDFAQECDRALILPALAVREKQRARGALVDGAIRALALYVWLLSWVLMRLATRLIFATMSNPTFEILGKLGGAVEASKQTIAAASGTAAASAPPAPVSPGSDYASHFRGVHGNPWIEKVPGVRRRRKESAEASEKQQ